MSAIYMDYNATTPPSGEILDYADFLQRSFWHNPNSIHKYGREARELIDKAREQCAEAIGAEPEQIIFTSCASESNAMAIKYVYDLCGPNASICNSPYEHTDIIENKLSRTIANQAALNYVLELDNDLLSIMLVNNESGRIFDVKQYAKMVHQSKYKSHKQYRERILHSDMSQAFGKIPINVKDLDVDFAIFSSQKIGSIRGCSVLYVKKPESFKKYSYPLVYGHQENGVRGGTENTVAIACMGLAMEKYNYDPEVDKELGIYKDTLIKELSKIPGAYIINKNTNTHKFTNNVIQVGFGNVDSETLVLMCDSNGLCISGGAACNSKSLEPSNEVKYLCRLHENADPRGIVRISYGRGTTIPNIYQTYKIITKSVEDIRKINGYKGE